MNNKNEKIAKWCGFTEYDIAYWKHQNLKYPINSLPDFPNDFSACLKWAVPKLNKKGYKLLLIQQWNHKWRTHILPPNGSNKQGFMAEHESLSVAFTDALEKVISEEKK